MYEYFVADTPAPAREIHTSQSLDSHLVSYIDSRRFSSRDAPRPRESEQPTRKWLSTARRSSHERLRASQYQSPPQPLA